MNTSIVNATKTSKRIHPVGLLSMILALFLLGCKPQVQSQITATPTATIINTEASAATEEPTNTPSPTEVPTALPSPEPTSTPIIEVISFQVSPVDGMVQVFIPPGVFEMGSEEGWDNENPVHTVNLDAFWIDQTEVTNQQYANCVNAGVCDPPGSKDSFSKKNYFGSDSFASYPVVSVSWYDAKAYCEWVGRRLPTEAEWEKAARGITQNIYPWGEQISCDLANYISCLGDTSAVGSFSGGASPFGALDMAGNVWEWVTDWYYIGYYKESPLDYPQGPDSGAYRVVRGGSWNDYEWYLRTTSRFSYFPDNKRVSIGFRCAMDVSP